MGQPLVIDTCDSSFSAFVAVYTGSAVNALGEVARSNFDCSGGGHARLDTAPGMTYHFRVSGIGSEAGTFKLNVAIRLPPPNDDFANAMPLAVPGQHVGTNVDATSEPGEPDARRVRRHSVWYTHDVADAAGRRRAHLRQLVRHLAGGVHGVERREPDAGRLQRRWLRRRQRQPRELHGGRGHDVPDRGPGLLRQRRRSSRSPPVRRSSRLLRHRRLRRRLRLRLRRRSPARWREAPRTRSATRESTRQARSASP